MSKPLRTTPKEVAEVAKLYPPGTRLLCPRNGKTYQMGTKQGRYHYWMLCEEDKEKAGVDARVIMREFQKAGSL